MTRFQPGSVFLHLSLMISSSIKLELKRSQQKNEENIPYFRLKRYFQHKIQYTKLVILLISSNNQNFWFYLSKKQQFGYYFQHQLIELCSSMLKDANNLKSEKIKDQGQCSRQQNSQEQSSFQIKPHRRERLIKGSYKASESYNGQSYICKLNESASWSSQEVKRVFICYQQVGTHWSVLQKNFPGRTQNDLKNKFYGTLRKLLRSLFKQVGITPGNKIRNLSANRLTDIYDGRKQFKEFKGILKMLLEQMDFQISRKFIIQFIDRQTSKITEFFYTIFPLNIEKQSEIPACVQNQVQSQIQIQTQLTVFNGSDNFHETVSHPWPFYQQNWYYNYHQPTINTIQIHPYLLHTNFIGFQ